MTRIAKHVLERLLKTADEELNTTLQHMAEATKNLHEAQEKGAMLQQYREDYIGGLENLLQSGTTKEVHRNYQNFLYKLDQAIIGQNEVIVSAEYQLKMRREQWQEAQRKKTGYETLIKRSQQQTKTVELKREQKMMDEFATRARRAQWMS